MIIKIWQPPDWGVAIFLSNLIYHCCQNLFKTELHKNSFLWVKLFVYYVLLSRKEDTGLYATLLVCPYSVKASIFWRGVIKHLRGIIV